MKNLIKKLVNNPKMNKVWWILVIIAIVLVILMPQIGAYFAVGVILFGILMWFNIDDKNKKEG